MNAAKTVATTHTTYLNLILLGNTLSNADNQTNFILNSLQNRISGGRRRDIEYGGIRFDFAHSLDSMSVT